MRMILSVIIVISGYGSAATLLFNTEGQQVSLCRWYSDEEENA